MPLPHHSYDPVPLTRLLRWLKRLPARLRCAFTDHWWRAHDIVTDECACCGKRRRMSFHSGERRPR